MHMFSMAAKVAAMHLASTAATEIRLTLDAIVELSNSVTNQRPDARNILDTRGFPRANTASQASIDRLTTKLTTLVELFSTLPDLDDTTAIAWVNEELTELSIEPSIVSHDGAGPHIHWTPSTGTFDNQVLADLLMALAQELCENGTIRFGRCAAHDCHDVFYDGTRNRSKRFCTDPRCASKTHTAEHRARQKP